MLTIQSVILGPPAPALGNLIEELKPGPIPDLLNLDVCSDKIPR